MVTSYDQDFTFEGTKKDCYVYEDTNVLINKLHIKDYDELNKAEKKLLKERILTPEVVESTKLDNELIKAIHRFYFGDLFDWAGKFRTITLYKEERFFIPGLSINYSQPEKIEEELKKALYHFNSVRWNTLTKREKAKEFALRLARLWKILPFRDGNTRTILGFAKIYAIEHGFSMDMKVLTNLLSRPKLKDGREGLSIRDMFAGACLDEYPEPDYLIKIIERAMQ